MFDDQEENQDQPKPSPARLRFSYWLAGLDPDSDPRLGGSPSGARQTGMTPGTQQADPTETWLALQAKQPFSPKLSIGQRMQPDAVSGQSGQRQPYSAIQTGMTPATRPGNLAQSRFPLQRERNVAPKLSIGQRLMQMDLDAASGRRTAIAPKLTLGQRLMGLDGRGGVRVDNPQMRQVSAWGKPIPLRREPGRAFSVGNARLQSSVPMTGHDAAKAAVIPKLRQTQANRGLGSRQQNTVGSLTGQTATNRLQIPLGGSPPPPSVPVDWLDKQKVNTLTVEQVAGIILGENGSGQYYKVESLPGRSTPEDLHRAKTAQALAVINGDLRRGKGRPQTHDWLTTEAQRKTPEYQQALEAARAAYQAYKLGADPTGSRMHFNNRFEKDVGKNEERLGEDRIVRDRNKRPLGRQKPFLTYGPFTVGGGKVWTLIYDDTRPIESKKQAPPNRKGQPVPARKPAPVK